MRRNQALVKQRAGKITIGPALAYDSADLAEQVTHLGFGWVCLDSQHGHHENLVLEIAAASKETGTPAGYVCATREMAELRRARGFRFINHGLAHFVLLDGMRAIPELARQWTEG